MSEARQFSPVHILPFQLHDISDFKVGDHPSYHPLYEQHLYTEYWTQQVDYCIRGKWGYDYNEETREGGWRFMPGNLYFYVNMGAIRVEGDEGRESIEKPLLRDVEWLMFYALTECDGFSGFEEDPNYTCFLPLGKLQGKVFDDKGKKITRLTNAEKISLENKDEYLRKPDGEYKEYISPRDALYRTYDEPVGRPMFLNNMKNLVILGSRGFGKSYSIGIGVIQYDFVFGSARTTDEFFEQRSPSNIVVGAYDSSKSKSLLDKFKESYEYMRKNIATHPECDDVNSVFYQPYEGSFQTGNFITNRVKEQGGKSFTGTGSKIWHVTYKDNPRAGVGERARRMIVEECFDPETRVIKGDGTATEIKHLKVGDYVLQPDGNKARVGRVCGGLDQMYKVEQKYGQDYIVNSKHLLHLQQKANTQSIKDDGLKNIPAEDFNSDVLGKYRLRITYGIQSEPIAFEHKELPLDPYFVGSYIGDGSVTKFGIVFNPKKDKEPMEWFKKYVESFDLRVAKTKCKGSAVFLSGVKKYNGQFHKHPVKEIMRKMGIYQEKMIPEEYLISSEEQRLQLLAGLIDTDGNISINAKKTSACYEISISKRTALKNQVVRLGKSLGFRVTVSESISNKGFGDKIIEPRTKYVVRLRGDLWKIPVKIGYKKVNQYDWVSDWRRTPIKVSKSHVGEYVGITLDSPNPYFLLEDYTVVHNCGLLSNFKEVHAENVGSQKRESKTGYTVYIGTGGDVTKIQGVRDAFYNPSSYDCSAYPDIFSNKPGNIGLFIPAYYRSNTYKDKNGNTNVQLAFEDEISIRNEMKGTGAKSYEGQIISYPIIPSEMFLQASGNCFPTALLEHRLTDLETGLWDKLAKPGKLDYVDKEKTRVVWTPLPIDEANPITRYGGERGRSDEEMKGSIVIYEHPAPYRPYLTHYNYMYIVCYDSISDEDGGTSLACVTVWKFYDFENSDAVQLNLVAEWIGRHIGEGGLDKDHEMAFALATYYDAPLAPELNLKDVRRYGRQTNRYHYFLARPSLALKGMEINTKKEYDIGLEIVPGMKPDLELLLNESLNTQVDSKNSIIGSEEKTESIRMASQIPSMRMCEELLYYSRDGNFDMVSTGFIFGVYHRQRISQPVQDMYEKEEEEKQNEFLNFLRGDQNEVNYDNPAFSY